MSQMQAEVQSQKLNTDSMGLLAQGHKGKFSPINPESSFGVEIGDSL